MKTAIPVTIVESNLAYNNLSKPQEQPPRYFIFHERSRQQQFGIGLGIFLIILIIIKLILFGIYFQSEIIDDAENIKYADLNNVQYKSDSS